MEDLFGAEGGASELMNQAMALVMTYAPKVVFQKTHTSLFFFGGAAGAPPELPARKNCSIFDLCILGRAGVFGGL